MTKLMIGTELGAEMVAKAAERAAALRVTTPPRRPTCG
jgi:hypothetical protein